MKHRARISLWARLLFAMFLCVVGVVACNAILGAEPGELAVGPVGTPDASGSSSGAAVDGSVDKSSKDITSFTLAGVSGTISGGEITVTVPFGTDVTSLAPTIVITGASVSPASGAAQDFSNAVTYTVTAADGTTKSYNVKVSVGGSGAKDITKLTILGINGAITGTSIAVTVPSGTDVTSLTPTIAINGASVAPASGAPRDFTNPVTYTVTGADGTTKAYVVTVDVATPSAKDITDLTIAGVSGVISGTSIVLTLPSGTSLASLTPAITITGASVSPASGVAQSFASPVTYTVTAADGTKKAYTVTVTVATSGSKDITDLAILGVKGTIAGTSIALTLPAGTNPNNLTPTVAITGTSVSPASGVAQDFTRPVTYTVTAADGSKKSYTVTVTVAASTAKDITSFSILGVSGSIASNSVSLTVPSGTNVTSLTPTIAITGSTVAPSSGVAQNFSSPVTYIVAAADGSTKSYTVTVTVAASTTKDITSFSILGVNGTINGTNIGLTLPSGTSVTSLTPTVAITGVSVSPASGVAQSFAAPVTYTVHAADGSAQAYTVTVTVAASTTKDITSFSILGVNGTITGTNITLTVPYGNSLTNLTPTIAHNGASVSPGSGVGQNFTNPVTYTVTAADNSTKQYTVTVTVAASNTKDITQFQILGINGTITGTNIALTVPYGTNVTSLTPTIVHTGANVSPASGVAKNFSTAQAYTVTAADNSTKQYTVTVTVAPSTTKDITQFQIQGVLGSIGANTVTVQLPFGTNKASLTPTITHNGSSISPASGVAQNFTNPVAYTVTAADNSTKQYTVTVNVDAPPACTTQTQNPTTAWHICRANAPAMTPLGGALLSNTYNHTAFWRNGGCTPSEKYHFGASTVFQQGGQWFMRYMIFLDDVVGGTHVETYGMWWLQVNSAAGTFTRTELCRAGHVNEQETGTYQQTGTNLSFNVGGGWQEGWSVP